MSVSFVLRLISALRAACPMNARVSGRHVPMTPALARDLRRIDAIWSGCRRDHGELGPYLFGAFSVADAMFAPVVLRVRSYGLPLSELARRSTSGARATRFSGWRRSRSASTSSGSRTR